MNHPAAVRVSTAKLRSAPGEDSKTVALLDEGRSARVVRRNGEWMKVRLATGTEGWVRRDLLQVNKKRVAANPSEPKSAGKKPAVARKLNLLGRVTEDDARLRSAPGTDNHVVTRLGGGSRLRILGRSGEWLRVKTADGTAGWVRDDLLQVSKKVVAPAKPKVVVVAKTVKKPAAKKVVASPKPKPVVVAKAKPIVVKRVASKPAAQKPVRRPVVAVEKRISARIEEEVPSVLPATTVPEPETRPEIKPDPAPVAAAAVPAVAAAAAAREERAEEAAPTVVPAEATSVAVPSVERPKAEKPVTVVVPKITVIDRSSTRGDRIVRQALSFRGTPYRSGATGRGAFDCSGFTKYLFGQAGSRLPRTAAEQFNRGVPVSKENLQPGDMVFFKNTYKAGVSHVGIYIGNGNFVHASSGGGRQVRVSALSEKYYSAHYAGARRQR